MSIEESAAIAKSRGFHTLAITDHSQSSAVAGGLSPERLRAHIKAVREANKNVDGITILPGSEVDILVDGTLDYDDDLLQELDVVVASPHAGLRAKPKQATKRLLKAIEHPLVHIIGHPTGRLIERRPGLEPDMNEIFAAAIEHDVALEINSHWMRLDLRDKHVRAAVEAGCLIAIDCDVHHADDYDNLRFGVLTGQRGWLTKDRCINTWDAGQLHAWLKSKR
jgi:DNA polymerase (family 10)